MLLSILLQTTYYQDTLVVCSKSTQCTIDFLSYISDQRQNVSVGSKEVEVTLTNLPDDTSFGLVGNVVKILDIKNSKNLTLTPNYKTVVKITTRENTRLSFYSLFVSNLVRTIDFRIITNNNTSIHYLPTVWGVITRIFQINTIGILNLIIECQNIPVSIIQLPGSTLNINSTRVYAVLDHLIILNGDMNIISKQKNAEFVINYLNIADTNSSIVGSISKLTSLVIKLKNSTVYASNIDFNVIRQITIDDTSILSSKCLRSQKIFINYLTNILPNIYAQNIDTNEIIISSESFVNDSTKQIAKYSEISANYVIRIMIKGIFIRPIQDIDSDDNMITVHIEKTNFTELQKLIIHITENKENCEGSDICVPYIENDTVFEPYFGYVIPVHFRILDNFSFPIKIPSIFPHILVYCPNNEFGPQIEIDAFNSSDFDYATVNLNNVELLNMPSSINNSFNFSLILTNCLISSNNLINCWHTSLTNANISRIRD
ncbi:hypothetical protein TVAG_331120 [Trichomonas vaginalis G3]|uniref:Uncharacterized protein n=1 Tax=Trichomonas vaginalis (strain ATCC PRA-98 / G3) TaxID=412133 RepID=A2FC31_TRIV3|nr:hypothetical protein TVAGG3_0757520 [Trichomonas vaginalis G3]EAX97526.1 hypothetical protein TVAG_331120 [Trichomonas vaginalis G3]KAI5512970.1 hypothetical protein TVAGG3_0757520 [Trichomonas vaginalis G3]|eukprot:XP_001310456.1 hypothetical protein [Trichomonas vaginalis G3]